MDTNRDSRVVRSADLPSVTTLGLCARHLVSFGDARLPDAFWERCMPEPMGGCWLWVGSSHPNGYGQFSEKLTGNSKAHRISYAV